MARILPGALTAYVFIALSDPAWAFFAGRSNSLSFRPRSYPTLAREGFSALASTSKPDTTAVSTKNGDDEMNEAKVVPTSPNALDHEHSDAETFDPFTSSAFDRYKIEHEESIKNPGSFWARKALEFLTWDQPFDLNSPNIGGFEHGDVAWFPGGKLNVCYNAIDRHVHTKRGTDVGLVWEGDEPGDTKELTYDEMVSHTNDNWRILENYCRCVAVDYCEPYKNHKHINYLYYSPSFSVTA